MARQPGLSDVDERLRRLSDIGGQLEAFAAVVDFEMFRPELVAALSYSDGAKGGGCPSTRSSCSRFSSSRRRTPLG
jgi:transposase, IS5 family